MRKSQRVRNFKSPVIVETSKVQSVPEEPGFLDTNNSIFDFIDLPNTQISISQNDLQNETKNLSLNESGMASKRKYISLNDALSESSMDLSQLFSSPFGCSLNKSKSEPQRYIQNELENNIEKSKFRAKRSLNEENLESQVGSQKFQKLRNLSLTKNRSQSKLHRSFQNSTISSIKRRRSSSKDFSFQNEIPSNEIRLSQTRLDSRVCLLQMQHSMIEKNQDNVIENDFDVLINSQVFTTQIKTNIEQIYEECEKSILQPTKCNTNDMQGLSQIEWGDDFAPNNTEIKLEISQNNVCKLAPIASSTFPNLGPFFGLPTKVKSLIQEFKGIEELYDWQKECLTLRAILQRENLIYALPTSGGKTLVAEILMLREIMCRKKNVIFILPYVSIVQEKIMALSPFAVHFDFLVEEYAAGKGVCPPRKRRKKNSIFIATIEKGLSLLNSLIAENRANEIGLIVVDELHLIGEVGRGGVLEMLLSKAILVDSAIQIIGMSATIGNINEIAEFLKASVYTRDFRPVELKEFIKIGSDIFEVNSPVCDTENILKHYRTFEHNYNYEAEKVDQDHIAALVQETIPKDACLIFCPTKQSCENVSILLSKMLSSDLTLYRVDEKKELLNIIERDVGTLCPILKRTIPYGVAYHHSNLTSDERKYLEDAFRVGILSVFCCTSTLAAGVNLPVKRVILRAPYIGRSFLTIATYKQMVGRAGRAGQSDHGESILLCNIKDIPRIKELLISPMDELKSSLAIEDTYGLQSYIISCIGLRLAKNRDELLKAVQRTLLYIQANRLEVNIEDRIDKILKKLFEEGALTSKVMNPIEFDQTLEINRLGKAAFKACITLQQANALNNDLLEAAEGLNLKNQLHLLYLATPCDIGQYTAIDASAYQNAYEKLKDDERKTANIIGLTEVRVRQILQGKKFSSDITCRLNRLFFTLALYDLWYGKTIQEVHLKFKIGRGILQKLMQNAATQASTVLRFSEELEEFWHFKQLFEVFSKRLAHCCSSELLPLMELPAVKIGRAKQLYAAGYQKLENLASASPRDLVENIQNMPYNIAKQLISAAKALLLERVENLKGEMEDVMENLRKH